MDFHIFFQSKKFKMVVYGLSALIVLLIVFKAGEFVGYRKANFSYRWGENYNRNFGGPQNGFMDAMRDKDFMNAHGVSGKIIKKDGATIVIQGRDNIEKAVSTDAETTIQKLRDTITTQDILINDYAVVIGEPDNNGQIVAKFIRVFPAPTASGSAPRIIPFHMW